MLVFENVEMFKAIYDSAKTIYPELQGETIVVGYANINAGVQLLEGTNEDEGKYKIVMVPDDDMKIMASFFIGGLSMLVYKLKSNTYTHPIVNPDNAEYKEIFDNIVTAFSDVPYKGEYTYDE